MSDDLDTPNGGKPQKKSSKVVDTLTNLTVAYRQENVSVALGR